METAKTIRAEMYSLSRMIAEYESKDGFIARENKRHEDELRDMQYYIDYLKQALAKKRAKLAELRTPQLPTKAHKVRRKDGKVIGVVEVPYKP